MANPHRGEVTFSAAGKSYTVRPTFGLIAEIEDKFGTVFQIMARVRSLQFKVAETVDLVILLMKHSDAPPPEATDWTGLREQIFNDGVMSFTRPIGDLLTNAVSDGKPAGKDARGNSKS